MINVIHGCIKGQRSCCDFSSSAQSAVEVENTVVGKAVGRQKQSGISNLCGICHSVEGSISEIGLLDFWLEI